MRERKKGLALLCSHRMGKSKGTSRVQLGGCDLVASQEILKPGWWTGWCFHLVFSAVNYATAQLARAEFQGQALREPGGSSLLASPQSSGGFHTPKLLPAALRATRILLFVFLIHLKSPSSELAKLGMGRWPGRLRQGHGNRVLPEDENVAVPAAFQGAAQNLLSPLRCEQIGAPQPFPGGPCSSPLGRPTRSRGCSSIRLVI